MKLSFHTYKSVSMLFTLGGIGTESCIRLVDVDGDGVDDVIIGLALGKDVTSMLTESSMADFCEKNGNSCFLAKLKHMVINDKNAVIFTFTQTRVHIIAISVLTHVLARVMHSTSLLHTAIRWENRIT